MLVINNLYKSYNKTPVLSDLNLEVKEGEVFGLIGPNGAGKSTLVKTILGLVKKDSGTIKLDGKEIDDYSIAKNIGATIENPDFYEYLTGRENLEIYKTLLGLDKRDLDWALDFSGLGKDANKKVNSYSLGMKQRLALSRSIISKPRLLILDEPTNGLDPKAIIELRSLIKQIASQKTTIIFCSHQLSEVKNVCTSFGFLSNAKIDRVEDLQGDEEEIRLMEELFL